MTLTPPRLSDGITTLRELTETDAPAYALINRDPLNVRWANSDAQMSADSALHAIRTDIPHGWQSGRSLRFGIEEAGALAGTTALHNVHTADCGGTASVGVKLLAQARGRGTAARAVELLLGYAFETLQLSVLHWHATVGNAASKALAERAGFTLEGTIRGYDITAGRPADGWIFSLTGDDWRTRRDGLPGVQLGDLAGGLPAEGAVEEPLELDLRPVVPTLRGGTVGLRALQPRDAGQLVANCLDPATVRWTTVPLNYSGQDALTFINKVVPQGWKSGQVQTFAVADSGTDQLLGTIDLQCKRPGTADIGINIGPLARGTGAAVEASRLLIDYAFGQLNLTYLYWAAMIPHWASRKLAWKLGFTLEGTIRGHLDDRGTPADAWILTLASCDSRAPAAPWDGPALENG